MSFTRHLVLKLTEPTSSLVSGSWVSGDLKPFDFCAAVIPDGLSPCSPLLVGMDGHLLPKDKDKIWAAYHSRDDLYRELFVKGFERRSGFRG